MENKTIYQEKDRSWIIGAAWYVALAALALALFAYGIFYAKAWAQLQKIEAIDEQISAYGTEQQKAHEATVYDYKKKIDDFALLVAQHKLSSNLFYFLEAKTLSGVVFSNVTLSATQSQARLSGQALNMATLGRQFSLLEASNEYVKNITVVNSQAAPSGNVAFVFNVDLDEQLFKYGAEFNE